MPRLTEEQLLERDQERVAKRRAKIEARNARADSALVRKLERLGDALVAIGVLLEVDDPTEWTLANVSDRLDDKLKAARVSALNGEA